MSIPKPSVEEREAFARELVQCHLLSQIFSRSLKDDMALKGGFAMRAHGSVRYTKDIDLAGDSNAKKRIQANVNAAMKDLACTGLIEDVVVSQPKQTDTTLRWKVGGRVGDSDLHLTVEISLRDKLPREHVRTTRFVPPPAYGLPPILCEAFDATALAASKVACLAGRQAPRDVYDLHVLIMAQVYPPHDLLRKYSPEQLRDVLRNVWENLEVMDFAVARTSLVPFLPAAAASRLDEAAWTEMQIVVGTHVQQWIEHVERVGEIEEPAPPSPARA